MCKKKKSLTYSHTIAFNLPLLASNARFLLVFAQFIDNSILIFARYLRSSAPEIAVTYLLDHAASYEAALLCSDTSDEDI